MFKSLGPGRGAARRTQGGRGVPIPPGALARMMVRPRAGTSPMGTSLIEPLRLPETNPTTAPEMHNPSLRIAPQTGTTSQTQHPNAQRQAQSLTRQQPLNRDLEVRSIVQENMNTLLTSSDHQNIRSRIQLSTHTYDQLNIESEDENQDPKWKGRGCNKEVDHPADTLEERVWIVPLPDGDWPVDSKIVRTIGHIIRHKSQNMHPNWSSVPRAEKLHYLAIFQSIYQWAPEYDLIIKTRWETQMKTSLLQAVADAKRMYDKGKRIEWLADDFLKQLERHWTSETFSRRSESCKRNRNLLACGTFTGGSRSSNHNQIKKGLDFCDNYEDTHMTTIVKKGVDGRSTITSKIWVDPRCEDIVNIYKEECTNKFGDRELWPKEVYADGWIKAAKPIFDGDLK
ncbi:hypothetical protein OROMI_001314 [Orobanche minor]